MATTSDLTPLQVRHAVSVLTALPLRLPEGKTISHRNLEFAERLFRNYLSQICSLSRFMFLIGRGRIWHRQHNTLGDLQTLLKQVPPNDCVIILGDTNNGRKIPRTRHKSHVYCRQDQTQDEKKKKKNPRRMTNKEKRIYWEKREAQELAAKTATAKTSELKTSKTSTNVTKTIHTVTKTNVAKTEATTYETKTLNEFNIHISSCISIITFKYCMY